MTWDEVCDDPALRDLPYRIETNGYGQIVMSSRGILLARRERVIARKLEDLLPCGEAIHNAPLQTQDGVKVPGVVWMSGELLRREGNRGSDILEIAPEICVEVMSRSNPMAEMHQKMHFYFEKDAVEVWLCDQKGQMHFFTLDGKIERSLLCPEFPLEIHLS